MDLKISTVKGWRRVGVVVSRVHTPSFWVRIKGDALVVGSADTVIFSGTCCEMQMSIEASKMVIYTWEVGSGCLP